MTSNINYAAIDENYPVSGQDNDTQGFRDNFSYIKTSLQNAKAELEDLQTKAVLKGELTNGENVDNNLGGGSIYNGSYKDFHGETFAKTVSSQEDIDVTSASAQVFTLTSDTNFTFRNWPGTSSVGKYAIVRIHVKSNSGTPSATFYSENGGTFACEASVTVDSQNPPHPKIELSANGKHKVLEFWSVTDGSNVYVRYLGEF